MLFTLLHFIKSTLYFRPRGYTLRYLWVYIANLFALFVLFKIELRFLPRSFIPDLRQILHHISVWTMVALVTQTTLFAVAEVHQLSVTKLSIKIFHEYIPDGISLQHWQCDLYCTISRWFRHSFATIH